MNYHPDDFLALSNAVANEGGVLLADPCEGEIVRYRLPTFDGRTAWKRLLTTHCDQSARMELPYDPQQHVRLHDDDQDDVIIIDHPGEPKQYEDIATETAYGSKSTVKRSVEHVVTVCAVDDAVGLWPRFAGVVSSRSYQTP